MSGPRGIRATGVSIGQHRGLSAAGSESVGSLGGRFAHSGGSSEAMKKLFPSGVGFKSLKKDGNLSLKQRVVTQFAGGIGLAKRKLADYKEQAKVKAFIAKASREYGSVDVKSAIRQFKFDQGMEGKFSAKEPFTERAAARILDKLDAGRENRAELKEHSKGAMGLKYMKDHAFKVRQGVKSEFFMEGTGRKYQTGDKLGGLEVNQLKEKGVEPGFIGHKSILPSDIDKIFEQKGHKFNDSALSFIKESLADENSELYDVVSSYIRSSKEDDLGALLGEVDLDEFVDDLLFEARDCSSAMHQPILDHIASRYEKFTTMHYVKQDYREKDQRIGITGKKMQQVPKKQSKGKIHRASTAKTAREANVGAMQEALVTDLVRVYSERLDMQVQKLKIVPSEYDDGSPKLLLDGTHMAGPSGEKFDVFAGNIKDGVLVDKEGNSDQSIKNLGALKILMLAIADRDAVGSRGDNKGFLIDENGDKKLGLIDLGHGLPIGEGSKVKTDLLDFKNINSDFSFDQPDKLMDKISGGYKQYTVFDDTSYDQKFEGVRAMKEMADSGEDMVIFDEYLESFGKDAPDGLNFKDEVMQMREAWVERRDYILYEVFGERLQADKQAPGVLNALDALEKLTSKTEETSASGDVSLKHLRVVDRQEWHVKVQDDSITFSTKNYDKIENELVDFLKDSKLAVNAKHTEDSLEISIAKGELDNFIKVVNENSVRAFKSR